MANNTSARTGSIRFSSVMVLAWFLSYAAARTVMEMAETPAIRVFFALLPIPFFVALVISAFRTLDRGDELFRGRWLSWPITAAGRCR